MIIPIGHEQTTVRRLPWVTFTIMAICVVVFLYTNASGGGSAQERFDEVAEYFLAHPYLELPQDLQNYLWGRGEPTQDQAEAATEALRSIGGGEERVSPRQLELEQQQLDELVERFRNAVVPRPLREHGLIPAQLEVVDLVTHMFLHGGWLHLLGNLFFLYLAGPFIEDVWGRPLFLGFYLLGGIVAGGLYAARYAELDVPLIGASGAIAAVMGAFLVRYFTINIRFFYWFGLVFRGTFDAPAWLMLPLWLARELVFAHSMDVVAADTGGAGVAYWAHVWGFAFGAAVAVGIRFARVEERYLHAAIERKVTLVDNAVVAQAMELRDRGEHAQALAILRSEIARDPSNPDLLQSFWTVASEGGAAAEAAPLMVRLVREHLRTGDMELAAACWWDLRREVPEAPPDLQVALRIGEWLRAEGRIQDAREVVRDVVEHVDQETPGALLVRLARFGQTVDASEAAVAAALALRHPETPPELAAELEPLAAQAAASAALPVQPTAPIAPVAPAAPAVATPAWSPPAAAGWAAEEAPDPPWDGSPTESAGTDDQDEEGGPQELEPLEIAAPPAARSLRVMEAAPTQLASGQLRITAAGASRVLDLSRVAAVAVAGIRRPSGPPFLLLDLLLDPPWSDAAELRLVRLLSTAFNPQALEPTAANPVEAFRVLVSELLDQSGAVPLPDPDAAAGNPFRVFAALDEYEAEVLGASSSPAAAAG